MATVLALETDYALELDDGRHVFFLCAWCGSPIAGRIRPTTEQVNFGICPACLKKELEELSVPPS